MYLLPVCLRMFQNWEMQMLFPILYKKRTNVHSSHFHVSACGPMPLTVAPAGFPVSLENSFSTDIVAQCRHLLHRQTGFSELHQKRTNPSAVCGVASPYSHCCFLPAADNQRKLNSQVESLVDLAWS